MKLPSLISCDLSETDEIEVEAVDDRVVVYAYRDATLVTSVHMCPSKVRRLAKALKKAAKRAERSA